MPLNEYEFKLNNAGVVLNEDTASMPFVDIERVSGLDSAPYRETVRDHEGTDGGFLDAEFERGREVILEGTAYSDTASIESYLDNIKENYAPVTTPIPFYFKTPGVDERLVFVKPRGARYDWELARRLGITNVQLLMYAEDPRIYDNELLSVSIPFGGAATTGFGFVNVEDTFTRVTSSGGWGTTDTGESWSGTDSQLSTDGSTGRVTHDAAAQTILNTLSTPTGVVDIVAQATCRVPVVAAGGNFTTAIRLRIQDSSNYYFIGLFWQIGGNLDLVIGRNLAGSISTIAGPTTITTYTGAESFRVEGHVIGSELRARVWNATSGTYPSAAQLTVTDTNFSSGTLGIRSRRDTSNSNGITDTIWDNFSGYRGFGFNLGFGADVPVSGGTVSVGGNRPTPAILTLSGAMVDPIIFNVTDSKNLAFTNLTLGVSDSLVIDLLNHTVVLNGTTNKRASLTTAEWWLFNPGNTFVVLGGGSGTGTLLVEYRNAWR